MGKQGEAYIAIRNDTKRVQSQSEFIDEVSLSISYLDQSVNAERDINKDAFQVKNIRV